MMSTFTAKNLNRKLLHQIRNEIANNPNHFAYEYYFSASSGPIRFSEVIKQLDDWKKHACGTSACIAGWAVVLGANKNDNLRTRLYECAAHSAAIKLLGIQEDEYFVAQFLFYPWEWDESHKREVRIDYSYHDAIARIDYLLAAPTHLSTEELDEYLQAFGNDEVPLSE